MICCQPATLLDYHHYLFLFHTILTTIPAKRCSKCTYFNPFQPVKPFTICKKYFINSNYDSQLTNPQLVIQHVLQVRHYKMADPGKVIVSMATVPKLMNLYIPHHQQYAPDCTLTMNRTYQCQLLQNYHGNNTFTTYQVIPSPSHEQNLPTSVASELLWQQHIQYLLGATCVLWYDEDTFSSISSQLPAELSIRSFWTPYFPPKPLEWSM